jgi:hypothetical protein
VSRLLFHILLVVGLALVERLDASDWHGPLRDFVVNTPSLAVAHGPAERSRC